VFLATAYFPVRGFTLLEFTQHLNASDSQLS